MRFEHEIEVADSDIDANGHANNVEFLRWMQEAAIAHSDEAGCTADTFEDRASWFARRHQIEYLRPAVAGDRIKVKTWVADIRRVASLRRYEFVRSGDGAVLAKGETDWVYVDLATGRPKGIPDEIRAMFMVEP